MLERNFGKKCVEFKSSDTVEILNSFNTKQIFTLDKAYDLNSTQKDIFEQTAKPLIDDVLKGYNATIFTYGQSGSGKTFTMYGEDLLDENSQGIIPRTIVDIFNFINDEKNKDTKFELKFSMLEIYMENIYDLLNPDMRSSELKIKEHSVKGIYVENLSEIYISSQEEFLYLIHEAEKLRSVSETSLNKNSSRSHLLFQLQITQKLPDDTEKKGFLNLIDLAGSEKVSKTRAIGVTLEEAKKINLSLSNLGNVIHALASNSDYIPYRDSKLTRILQDSLGGNSKTTLIVNCSIHSYNAEETISTLQFAKRAKKIKNKVKINIKRSPEQLESIIDLLTSQLKKANDEIDKLKFNTNNNMLSPSKTVDNLIKSSVGFNNFIENSQSEIFSNKDSLNFLYTNDQNIKNNKNKTNNPDNEINENENSFNSTGDVGEKNHFEILSDIKNKYSKNLYDKIMNEHEKDGSEYNTKREKEKIYMEIHVKNKDKEIKELKENLESLYNQNNQLKDKIEQLSKDNYLEKIINNTENSMKEFIKELKNSYDSIKENEIKVLKENLVELKNYQIEMEDKYLEIFRDITNFKDLDFTEKLNFLNEKNPMFCNNINNEKDFNNLSFINNSKIKENNKILNNNIKDIGNNFNTGNIYKEFDLNAENESILFENNEEMNISVSTNNIKGINNINYRNNNTNTNNRNTSKFTMKRLTTENNTNVDKISVFSNNENLIKKNSLNENKLLNMKNILSVNNKSKTEKIFNTNFDKNKIKKLNVNDGNIKVIDDLSPERFSNNENLKDKNNKFIIGNKNNLYNYNYTDRNIKDKENIVNLNYKKKLILDLCDYNFSCEEIFKKIEKNIKDFTYNSQNNENSEKKLNTSTINPKTENYQANVILSYKKIFSNNKFFSKKILEDFLKHNQIEFKSEDIEENNIFHTTNKNLDDNKSTLKTIERKNDNNYASNQNNVNYSTIQEDFFSVNDKFDRKDHIRILNDLNITQSKKEFDFTVNNKNNNHLFIENEEKRFNSENKIISKLKNGFIQSILKILNYWQDYP